MIKTKPSVRLHFPSKFNLAYRGRLKAFSASIFKKEKKSLKSLNIIFCDDNYLLELNQEFLKHDFYTDILSFRLSPPGEPLVAEIYISIDRVRDNAKNLNSPFKSELYRVIFHGILHFCGYKDKTHSDILKMRAMEDKWLKRYNHIA
ncbi:MAG TPA: rRNA maturation RNase YbeY [Puia sp.]|jgi:probable rRNA maturation factor|nr:rRNA maturation RNase YbeY [Puia sp.]